MNATVSTDFLLRVAQATPEQQAVMEQVLAGAVVANDGRGAALEGPNVYRLGRGHKAWHLTFQGKPEVLADERAVHLVEYLLKHPPEEAMHALVLENRVDGSPVADGFAGVECGGDAEERQFAVGGVIQEATGKELLGGPGVLLKRALAEQRSIRDDETLPLAEREAARQEIRALLSAYQSGGRTAGGAGKAADRVRKAIKTFIEDLKAAEVTRGTPNAVLRAFGEHLERCLWWPSMGSRGRAMATGRAGCFIYERPPGVVWRD